MRKSDRLFQLTNILRRHQPITARQLAERLSVSERTIYRYIDDLSLSGIPVYGEAGVGYRLSEGFELPPLQLSPAELEALVTGVTLTTSLTGNSLAGPAHSLLSKIEAALAADASPVSGGERVVRVPARHDMPETSHVWDAIHLAIREGRRLAFRYTALSGEITERDVFPLGLFYWGGKWTLGAWCTCRNDYRDFRIDRMDSICASSEAFPLPENVSLSAYITIQSSTPLTQRCQ